jgi:histidine triad (HIT) family protein
VKACPFCAIVRGELSASIVSRGRGLTAFLDARPVFKGHVLVVPDVHIEEFTALPAELCGPLLQEGQRVARAFEAALGAQGAFVALNHRVSQSVAHVHLHAVPRTKGDGLRGFFWPRTSYESDAERDAIAARIAAALPPEGSG